MCDSIEQPIRQWGRIKSLNDYIYVYFLISLKSQFSIFMQRLSFIVIT